MQTCLLGLAWDASSSHSRGPALAPAIINALLQSTASSPYSLSGVSIEDCLADRRFPALPDDAEKARAVIGEAVAQILAADMRPLSLGGDHSVTYPILRAMADRHGPLNILHVDAHPDLYDSLDGDRFSHACPFRRAVEDGCVNRLVQVGIRSATPEQRDFAEEHGIVMLTADEWDRIPYAELADPLYVSIDLDGIDPAFAPGVSHPEPGGLSSREVISLVGKITVAPVGADIVELNPERDIGMLTANLAGRLVKELASKMSE